MAVVTLVAVLVVRLRPEQVNVLFLIRRPHVFPGNGAVYQKHNAL